MTGPRRSHEPRELPLMVSRTENGALRLGCPWTPGWAFVARSPAELALGVERAYAEAAVAAYARLRGAIYDLAETEEVIPPAAYAAGTRHPEEPLPPAEPALDEVEVKRRKKHPRTHPPEAWVELSDGAMLSPSGQRYRPDSLVASRVRARRTSG